MPTRFPAPDNATFRDLKIFEERLKDTAASLQRRKSRYQLFLAQLLVVIASLLFEIFLKPPSSILVAPFKMFLVWLLPDIYTIDSDLTLHPYLTSGLLFVSVTTLVLFFASGMYSEKIAYANKYVPHTNRSLRSFNMYFNTRRPPLRSQFYWNPLSFFFPRPDHQSPPSSTSRSPSPPSRDPFTRNRSQSASRPIPSIPPANNPRGELIFSSRIEKTFREGFDRYRSTFEKRREETINQIREQRKMERWGWLYRLKFWGIQPPPITLATPTPSRSVSGSSRGRGGLTSRSGTPPIPGTVTKQRDRSGSPLRQAGGRQSLRRRTVLNSPDGSERNNRRELGDSGDFRLQALERSHLAQGPQ